MSICPHPGHTHTPTSPQVDVTDLLQQTERERDAERARADRAEAEVSRLKAERQRVEAVLANKNLGPSRRIGAALAPTLLGTIVRQDGFCDMTARTFGERTGFSEETSRQILEELTAAGLLEIQRHPYRYTDRNGREQEAAYLYHRVPTGDEFEEKWGNPAAWGPLPKTKTVMEERKRKSAKRQSIKDLIRAAEGFVMECPDCGGTCRDMACKDCGTLVSTAEVLRALESYRRKGAGSPTARLDRARAMRDVQDGSSSRDEMSEQDPNPDSGYYNPLNETSTQTLGEGAQDHVALQAAARVLAPALTLYKQNHIVMRRRAGAAEAKYYTVHEPMTSALIEKHLRGEVVLGTALFGIGSDGKRVARSIAWDSDCGTEVLKSGAIKLAAYGLRPVLEINPYEPDERGHLWLFFDRDVEPSAALRAAESIAPELATVKERFSTPDSSNGGRIRLPGGLYHPIGKPSLPVHLAAGTSSGDLVFADGNTPEAWAIIAAAISDASLLPDVPEPERLRAARECKARRALSRGAGDSFFKRFREMVSIEELVEINRASKFVATWRGELEASVHVYPGDDESYEHAIDYGDHRRHLDAFDIFCLTNGLCNEDGSVIDRRAGMKAALVRWPELAQADAVCGPDAGPTVAATVREEAVSACADAAPATDPPVEETAPSLVTTWWQSELGALLLSAEEVVVEAA